MSGRNLTSRTAQRAPARFVLAAGALVAAVAHVPVTPEHVEEAPYMGVLFVLLIIGCTVLAVAALVHDAPLVYSAAAAVCSAAIIGYAATRLVPFPKLADDVGNWWEPLGVVSVISEGVVLVAALFVLSRRHGRLAA